MSNVGKTISTEWKKKNGVTTRWGVRIWWKGIRHDIYKIPVFDGHLIPCESEETAKQLKLIINNDILRGTFNPDRYKKEKKLHLEQYAKDWLKRRKDEISAATYHDYDNSIKNYIVPLLGNRYLGDIGSKDLEDFIKDVKRKPAGVQNVMGCLKKIMRDAKRWEDISELPIFPVVKVPEGPHRWYEMSEQMKIVDHLDEYAQRLVLFMMLSGCRTAEARALRWQDIKKDHIEIAVTFDRNEDLKLPKNGEPDTIPLTDALRPLRNPARSVYLGLIGIFSSKYQVRGLIFLPESSPAPCIRRYSHAPDTPVPRSPSQAPVPLNLSGTIASG